MRGRTWKLRESWKTERERVHTAVHGVCVSVRECVCVCERESVHVRECACERVRVCVWCGV